MASPGKILNTFWPAILWALLILFACSLPGATFRKFNLEDLFTIDKLIHAFLFFGLVYLLLIAQFRLQNSAVSWKLIFFWLIVSIIYGGSLELMQSFVFSERAGDIPDFIANTFGGITGVFIFKLASAKMIIRK